MKWLIWSKIDLEKGLGGVEVHAQCVARELQKNGIEVVFSQDDRAPFKEDWDVVQTHGSQYNLNRKFFNFIKGHQKTKWIHTLHGWSIDRVLACREYHWIGGYKAWWRERVAANNAHYVFGVHEDLARRHRVTRFSVCGNGWDSENYLKKQPMQNIKNEIDGQWDDDIKRSWLFIGRGSDKVKGAHRLLSFADKIKIAAIPGDGFEMIPWVVKTGVMSPQEVSRALMLSRGLIVPSYYEGLPLVVLEALGHGVPVVTTKVGGLRTLDAELKGLYFCDYRLKNLFETIKAIEYENSRVDRAAVALHNRKFLKTWQSVAESMLHKVGK